MVPPLLPIASTSSSPLLSPSPTRSIRGRSAGNFKRSEKSGAASGAVEGKTDIGAGGHESVERELRSRVVTSLPRLGAGWRQISPLQASVVTIGRSALRAPLNPALRSLRLRSSVLGRIAPRNSPIRHIQTKISGHAFTFESRRQHRLLESYA